MDFRGCQGNDYLSQMSAIRLEKDAKERREGYWATTYIQYLVSYLTLQSIVD